MASYVPQTWTDGPGSSPITAARLNYIEGGISAAAPGSLPTTGTNAAAPAYLKTVSDLINGEPVSVMRAIPTAQHDAVYSGTSSFDATSSIQDILSNMPAYGSLVFPRGKFITGNLQVQNKTDFKLLGQGARLQLVGDGTSGNGVGIQLLGTISGLEIAGFHIVGDGIKAHKHAGVWNNSGQALADLSIHHNLIEQVHVGISINANSGGTIDGFDISHNVIKDVVGIVSGDGYGIHTAYQNSGSVRGVIGFNRIYRAGRHSIYCARVADLDIVGNRILGHRSAITTAEQADPNDGRGKTRPALNIARSRHIRVRGNWFMDGYDSAIAVVPNPDQEPGVILYDVAITENHFLRPQDSVPPLLIGDPSPDLAGVPTDILVQGNDFYADYGTLSGVGSVEQIRVNDGVNVKVKNNRVVIRGVNQTTAAIGVRAQAETTGTHTYSDHIEVEGNTAHLVTNNGSICRGVVADATLTTSGVSAALLRNEATGDAANAPTYAPAFTNPNLRVGTRTGDVYAVAADGDTSPSVGRGVTLLDISASATTLITTLDDAEEGQQVTLKFNDLNVRLVFGTPLRIVGNQNYVSGNRQTITLVYRSGVWYEIARSAPLPLPVLAWAAGTTYALSGLVRLPTGGLAYSANGVTTAAAFDATERAKWQFLPGGHAEAISSGATSWVCPSGITEATFEMFAAGGGGGGGGSASSVSTQVGGGGGGAGERASVTVAVTPGTTYTVAIGTGGPAGAGAASGGAAGASGTSGGDTTISIGSTTYIARGGTAGAAGAANSTTSTGGGVPGRVAGFTTTTAGIPGCGGVGTSASGTGATPLASVIGGGAGAPAASTALGGSGGAARTSVGSRVDSVTTSTGTAAGGNGTSAAQVGCGGGGGGGGAVGGAGGSGGVGFDGQIVVRF